MAPKRTVLMVRAIVVDMSWRKAHYPRTQSHMVRKRISIGKILARALLCLLLCGIVAGELPELLSLTDNATNDFTVSGARSVVPPVRLNVSQNGRIADKDSAPASDFLFSRESPFEKAELVPSDVFILYSILRT